MAAENDNGKQNSVAEPGRPAAGRQSRTLIGANVVVASVLVLAVVGAVNYIANWATRHYDLTTDLTAGSQYSFSSRTRMILGRLDAPVRLTSLYVADPKDEQARQYKQRTEDLLRQYQSSGRGIEIDYLDPIENVAALRTLGQRINKLYAGETAPYVQAVKDYYLLQAEIAAAIKAENDVYAAASQASGLSGPAKDSLNDIVTTMQRTVKSIDSLTASVEKETGLRRLAAGKAELAEIAGGSLGIPEYNRASAAIGATWDSVNQVLDLVALELERVMEVEGAKLPQETRIKFQKSQANLKEVQKKLAQAANQLKELKPLELFSIQSSIQNNPNTIIVEAGAGVRVLPFDEVWPTAPGQQRYDPTAERRFSGEDAVTSALLALTSKSKPAAIIVQWGDQMPVNEFAGPFTDLVTRLKHANFTVVNWDLQQQPEMPKVENASKVVLVVLVPPAQQQDMGQGPMMPPTAERYRPVRNFVEKGGSALVFLQPQAMPTAMPLPYLELLRFFGLETRIEAILVQANKDAEGVEHPNTYLLMPWNRYPSPENLGHPHLIVKPLQNIAAVLHAPTPILISKTLPPGTEVWPLLEVSANTESWGETDLMAMIQKGVIKFDSGKDVPAPLYAAVAATRTVGPAAAAPVSPAPAGSATPATPAAYPVAGGGQVAKLVVFGDQTFASDRLASISTMVVGGQLALLDFPGNGELINNSMLWLADQEGMISLSPKAQQPRLLAPPVDQTTYNIIRWSIWGGLPALVVLIGVVVYTLRIRVR